jgi:rod shape-determining protein MreC
MRYLFLFLKKQSFFLLFVLFELTALLIFFNHNNYQGSRFLNSTNAITGGIYSAFDAVGEYFHLNEANRQLSNENARLMGAVIIRDQLPDTLFDTDTGYVFIPARVISNSSRNRNNFIMIDKGQADGIEREMGVISPGGVAGIIIEVSRHYATAMSLLHKNARVSAKLKKNGQMVTVTWDGVDYRRGMLEDIPTHIKLEAGDTVITSGFSFVFPENVIIGTVGENIIAGANFNRAELMFSTDFNSLYYVYVVQNKASDELDSLKMLSADE